MKENPGFTNWAAQSYNRKYPVPPRDRRPFRTEDAAQAGFNLLRTETYTNDVCFTCDELITYLTTQTNIIAAVESGQETIEEASSWLRRELGPLFATRSGTFLFGGPIAYLQKH